MEELIMTRQEKYPDTRTFHFYNANPHNRFTTDCVVRAISTSLEIEYNTVVKEMAELQCKTGFDPSEKTAINKYLAEKKWVKVKQPRKTNNTKYTGKEFCEWLNKNNNKDKSIIANIGGHHIVCIKKLNGKWKIFDTWNSADGCIGNYWVARD